MIGAGRNAGAAFFEVAMKIKGPKGCAESLSWRGKEYRADKRGVFDVPDDAVKELSHHGFERVAEEPREARK